MVRLYLFGAPRLERDGVALPLRRSKALALLAYLAATGRPREREALLGLLWAEFPEADARNNLRRELSQLRATLGDAALHADRRQIAWSQDPAHWVDVAAFRAQLAAGHAHAHPSGLCEDCAAALAAAVQLASAELLEGYNLADSPAFEDWLFFEREELRQQLGHALEALVGWHGGRCEFQPALALARRWLSLDPLHEPPRRALMELAAQSGQYAAALRHYEEGVRLLDAELGTAPEPATTALYEAIRSRELAPGPAPAQTLARAPAPANPPARAAELVAAGPPLTSFIGRRDEITLLAARLTDSTCHLLSLLGPGGIGKTRLAGELAAHVRGAFADGMAVVPLSGTALPAQLPGAIDGALGVVLMGASDGWPELEGALREREQLLLLDNFEQLAEAAPALARLLRAAPRLKLLVTSREALGLVEEWRWTVPGLAVPPADDAAPTDAMELFLARAEQRSGAPVPAAEYAEVARVCRLVGGMPLAIELAAAWTATLACREIADEIAGGLDLLATELQNVPERHRSVRAVFAQTWAQLPAELQRALARMALLPAGCTRELAAVAGAPPSLLTQLVERALLHRTANGRYQLHPLVRQYAAQRLHETPAEEQNAAAAFGRYYGQLLSEQFLLSKDDSPGTIAVVRMELDNIRSLLPAILEQTTGESLRQALHALQNVYFNSGPYQEGTEVQLAAEAHLRSDERPASGAVLADVLNSLGLFAVRRGQVAAGRAYFEASSALFARLGATPNDGDATDPEIGLGLVALVAGDYRAASRYAERVRTRNEATGHRRNQAYSWYLRAEAAQAQGLLAAAHTAARKALALCHSSGAVWLGAYIRNQLGQIAAAQGRFEEADAHFWACYAIRETYGDHEGMAIAILGLGESAAQRGDHAGAARRFADSLARYEQTGDRGGKAQALLGLGAAQAALGDYPRAWEQIQAALRHARAIDFHHVVLDSLVRAAAVLVAADSHERAAPLLALALVHPASRAATTTRAQDLLARCEEQLPPAGFAAAVARAQAEGLDARMDELLATSAPLVHA